MFHTCKRILIYGTEKLVNHDPKLSTWVPVLRPKWQGSHCHCPD
jgi:hypothetical protein